MILQALNQYYHRLESDPDVDIAPFGYSRQKISFCVVINDDGTLHEIIEETDGDAAKPRPKSLIVPGGAKPSGSGINPRFLWDNTGYMLGFKPDDEKPVRTLDAFEAFRTKSLLTSLADFLPSWKRLNRMQSKELWTRSKIDTSVPHLQRRAVFFHASFE